MPLQIKEDKIVGNVDLTFSPTLIDLYTSKLPVKSCKFSWCVEAPPNTTVTEEDFLREMLQQIEAGLRKHSEEIKSK